MDIADQLAQAYADGWRAGSMSTYEDKSTKTEVDYQEANDAERRCGTCNHYHGDDGGGGAGTCNLVTGSIDAEYVCDLWARDTAPDPGDADPSGDSHSQSVFEGD